MWTTCMNHRGSYAPIGIMTRSNGPHRSPTCRNWSWYAVSPAKNARFPSSSNENPHQSVLFRSPSRRALRARGGGRASWRICGKDLSATLAPPSEHIGPPAGLAGGPGVSEGAGGGVVVAAGVGGTTRWPVWGGHALKLPSPTDEPERD